MSNDVNRGKLSASMRLLDKIGEMNLIQLRGSDPEAADRLDQLGALLGSEDFCKQLAACADKEAAAKLFADHCFAITMEELEALVDQIKGICCKLAENDGELSDEDLEMIAGGGGAGISDGVAGTVAVTAAAVCGATIGSAIFPFIGTAIGAFIGVLASSWLVSS